MTNKISIPNLITFALILICIAVLIFKPDPQPVYSVTPEKIIETRIQNKEEDILGLMNQIVVDRKIISNINSQLKNFKLYLAGAKVQHDTLKILRLQDIIINKQDTTIVQYERMDQKKDSVIIGQRYIINSKDTIIAIKDHEIKRFKRQRNISLLLNAIQTAIIVFK